MKHNSKNMLYRGVDVDKALKIPRYGEVHSNFYKSLFTRIRIKRFNSSKIIIIYFYCESERMDFDAAINALLNHLKVLNPVKVDAWREFVIFEKFTFLKHLFAKSNKSTKGKETLIKRLVDRLMVARVKTNVDYVYETMSSKDYDVIVTFSDAHEYDNTLSQCVQNMQKTTVTLQHGQYLVSNNPVPENELLSNIVSDYFCAWGRATCDEFYKVNNSAKIKILGPLGKDENKTTIKLQYLPLEIGVTKVACLMLNADNSFKKNVDMILLVNNWCLKSKWSYCVKYHPKNNKSLYEKHFGKDFLGSMEENSELEISFSIVYTSGVVVELLILRKAFLIYCDEDTPDIYQNKLICFNAVDQLESRVIELTMSKSLCQNMERMRDYFVETKDIKNNYLNFFKEINSEI